MKIVIYTIVIVLFITCNSQSPEKLWEDAKIMQLENNLNDYIVKLELIIKDFLIPLIFCLDTPCHVFFPAINMKPKFNL